MLGRRNKGSFLKGKTRRKSRRKSYINTREERLLRITFVQSIVSVFILGTVVLLNGFGMIDDATNQEIYSVIKGDYTNAELVMAVFEDIEENAVIEDVISLYREPVDIPRDSITSLPPVPYPPQNSRGTTSEDETLLNEVDNMDDKEIDDELELEDDIEDFFDDVTVSLVGSNTSLLEMIVESYDDIVRDGVLTDEFGFRIHPITNKADFHTGIDIGANIGTPITSPLFGEVSYIGYSEVYGNYIEIKHSNNIYTYYAHCDEILADVGDFVLEGETIATIGNTGLSTGPHLHFEVMVESSYIDPQTIFMEGKEI